MDDLEIVLNKTHFLNENEMCNHLKEIFVLCKLCFWNTEIFYLDFIPYGVKLDSYPKYGVRTNLNLTFQLFFKKSFKIVWM